MRPRSDVMKGCSIRVLLGSTLTDFPKYAGLRATLDDAPLVLGDATKGAAAETPPHGDDGILDRLVGRYAEFVGGMR